MTRITNGDQVLLMLRARLERLQKGSRLPSRAGSVPGMKPGALERAKALTIVEELTEAEQARALLAGILAHEFGAAVTNDPAFQRMVDEVQRLISSDQQARDLLRSALRQLVEQS